MFLKGVWLIIAGVLLLGYNPALAEPYLRVCKKGVVYYYFPSREPSQPRQAGRNTPKLRGEAWIQEPPQHHNPPPATVKGLSRVEPKVNLATTSPQGAPGLRQLGPGTPAELPVVDPYDAKEYIGAATGYLIRLLTKLGYDYPPVLPAYDAGPHLVHRQKDVTSAKTPQVVVLDPWANFLKKYAQEQRAESGQVRPGSGYTLDSSFSGYSFPVAGPFSFRDSWGEARSGGRHHRAVDIAASEGTEVYAVTAGVIQTLATFPEAGIILLMRGQDGRGYGYMHLQGYAAGIVEGKAVRTGELIGYVGRTGIQQSAAHLHFQVYADNRLCKDDLLNPYGFLVQLCQGVGVTDLYQHRFARVEEPQIRDNRIQVYRRSGATAHRGRDSQFSVKDSSILVIKNY